MAKADPAKEASDKIAQWREHPDIFVREVFGATPDPWQDEVLRAFPTTPRIAMKASKGPGKSCVEAWCCWNFLSTRPHPNIAATSISGDNLRDGLWKEMAHWRNKSEFLKTNFEWQGERIFNKSAKETWFMSARTWSKAADPTQLGNTLAGLHSDYIMFVIDEAGAIPIPITMAAEAGLSSCKEGHIMQAGNTNTLDGSLYDACITNRHLWKVIVISGDPDDPRRSTRINIEWAREMIRTWGRDSPFVKVMVLGEWPSASINALLGPEEVEQAMKRKYQQHDIDHAARILGVDVAREGDDASVIFPRQGLVAFKPIVMRNVTGNFGAAQINRMIAGSDGAPGWPADAIFIDNTGGFGSSWIDHLTTLNRAPLGVHFSEKAQSRGYANKRAEMYVTLRDWVRAGGALPDVPELVTELTQTTYTFQGDALILEPKKLIKAKIGRSPDHADGLALTFTEPVQPKAPASPVPQSRKPEGEYDVFKEYYEVRA